jgi:hypothetical protein
MKLWEGHTHQRDMQLSLVKKGKRKENGGRIESGSETHNE